MTPYIIYHGKCADGFTSAWLANRYFHQYLFMTGTAPDDWVVPHHAAVYGQEPPADIAGRDVFILDFSYPRDVLLQMGAVANSITIIDHHASAAKDLVNIAQDFAEGDYCPITPVFNMDRSGAYLTSLFFWPDRDPHDMVKLVDDRDRWVFADSRTRPFSAALFSRPYKIGEWNRLSETVAEAVIEGTAIERKNDKDIEELLEVCMQFADIDGHTVPVANLPHMSASDACHKMLQRNPDAPFTATWFKRGDGMFVYSLRSRTGSDVDVSAIAKKFGGGGHKHAAGLSVTQPF